MSTLLIAPHHKQAVTAMDFLMLTVWSCVAFLCVVLKVQLMFGLAVVGGVLFIFRHFYTVMRQRPSVGELPLAACIPVCLLFFGSAHGLVHRLTPVTRDALLLRLDHGVSHAVRAWGLAHRWALVPLNCIYLGLILIVMFGLVMTSGLARKRLTVVLFASTVFVLPFYLLCPAVGPVHVTEPAAFRNCIPSMHLTWAVLVAVYNRGWVKRFLSVLAVLTALSTMTTGEHYFVDLVLTTPWIIGLVWLTNRFVCGAQPCFPQKYSRNGKKYPLKSPRERYYTRAGA